MRRRGRRLVAGGSNALRGTAILRLLRDRADGLLVAALERRAEVVCAGRELLLLWQLGLEICGDAAGALGGGLVLRAAACGHGGGSGAQGVCHGEPGDESIGAGVLQVLPLLCGQCDCTGAGDAVSPERADAEDY